MGQQNGLAGSKAGAHPVRWERQGDPPGENRAIPAFDVHAHTVVETVHVDGAKPGKPSQRQLSWRFEPPAAPPPPAPKGRWWAGWLPDPRGRHDFRYWDGKCWTDNVADDGAAGVDPV